MFPNVLSSEYFYESRRRGISYFSDILAPAEEVPAPLSHLHFSHLRSGLVTSFENSSKILSIFLSIVVTRLIRGFVLLGMLCGTSGGYTQLKDFGYTLGIVISAATPVVSKL